MMFKYKHTAVCVLAVMVLLMAGPRQVLGLGSGDPGFGKQWTRTNPFVIMGTSPVYMDDPNGAGQYWDTNHTVMIANEGLSLVKGWTQPYDKTWIRQYPFQNWSSTLENWIWDDITEASNVVGWNLGDEPSSGQLSLYGTDLGNGVRAITKERLVYMNMGDVEEATLDALFSTLNPDVLQYDRYPFLPDGTTGMNWYLSAMMKVRNRALAENVPYWGYLQSYANASHRVCSESDMRMNVYSHLTTGFTGLQYFTHVQWTGTFDAALLDASGNPDTMYYIAQDVNAEVQNLGQALRLLESTDVRWIIGQSGSPTGEISNWSAGAGGDTHMTNVVIDGGQSGAGYKNGMIGFFDDYVGEKHFMLTNLDHAAGTSAAAASLDFTVTFDSSVTSLLRLNRETGVQEVVPLTGNQLQVTLLGGTGELYKYNTGDFLLEVPQMILEMIPVDEPAAPLGYTAYDIIATTGSNVGPLELVLEADAAGDIHQVSSNPTDSTDPSDTYVTMPVSFSAIGAAVDIDPGSSQVWDDQDLNVAWAPSGGANSFPGAYQVARIMLKNNAQGSYTLKGWQTGGWDAVVLTADFGLPGDVDGDGFVGGADLSDILTNWGLNGASRFQGDLTGDGFVGGADYSEVLTNWGAGTPPEAGVPEPAALALLLGGALICTRRRR